MEVVEALTCQAMQAPSAPPAPTPDAALRASVVREHVENQGTVSGGLVELGIPRGLADLIAKDDSRIGMRIYLLDNSGSMNQNDGKILCDTVMRDCSRWEEICAFAEEHARFNWMVGTPCEFALLNSLGRAPGTPAQEGRDFIRIDSALGNEAAQLAGLKTMLNNNGPRGVTPIADRLDEIFERVSGQTSELAAKGQSIFLTIATDGLPTSSYSGESTPADKQHLVERLRYLGSALPFQLVVRLCTDDDSIVDFYNSLDQELEFPLDILDDIVSESREVAIENKNHWFAYTPLLHRLREAGTLCKVFDSIDEKPLTPQEVRYLTELLVGPPKPLVDLSDRDFISEVEALMQDRAHVYDAASQKMQPVINICRLRVAMQVGFRGNVLPWILPWSI